MSVDHDAPVDGLDQAVHLSPAGFFKAIYAFFYNKRVGLILILIPSLLGLMGVLFPQAPAGVLDDPSSRAGWLDSVRQTFGGWTDVLAAIGFFSVFKSIPFMVAMILLALSIIACTTHRVPTLWQAGFRPHTKVTAGFFEHARLNASFISDESAAESFETVRAHAAGKRVRIIEDDRGPGLNLYTDKWHWAPFGTTIAHVAFVVIMAGFFVSSTMGFRDEQFTLTVGIPAAVGHGTDLTAEAKSFSDTYYDNGTPKDYVTDLVITEGGQEVARQDVRVNAPLTYDGIMFHQAFFGVAGVMQITDASGTEIFHDGVPLEWNTKDRTLSYGVLEVPGHDLELFVIGSASGQTGTGIAPGQMRIEVYPIGQDAPLGTAVLDQGGHIEVEGLTFTFEREQQYTGLIVKRDPGAWIVWLGSAMLVIGTCLTMFFRHHRIWFRVSETDDGTLVQLASPDRQDATFKRQFDEITADLTAALTDSSERID